MKKPLIKQLGQGMTEYIIIIALIAIAAIGAFTFFGDGLKDQVGNVTAELTGGEGTNTASAANDAALDKGTNMGTYTGQNK